MHIANRHLTKHRRLVLSGLRWVSYFFLLGGLLALGYVSYVIADAQAYQAVELRKFSHHAPLTEPHLVTIGETVGQIEIPRLALSAAILHGDSSEVLRRGVGHLPETPFPGEWGNVGLAGHRDTFFRTLRQIRPGDVITLRTFHGQFEYRVESTRIVSPASVEVLGPSDKRELTLVTCFPFTYVGAAPNRFIVRAVQVSANSEQAGNEL